MIGLPAGTVTLLFSDMEGSSRLLQALGDVQYGHMLEEQAVLLRRIFVENAGHVIGVQGDAFLVAFPRATDAVAAALALQRALAEHPWPRGVRPKVRIGIHTGEPVSLPASYAGLDVHRAARITAAGHGGQILVSATTASLVSGSLPEGAALRDMGRHRLKDLEHPEQIFQVDHPSLEVDVRPLASLTTLAHNVPSPSTSFIGREKEVAEIKEATAKTRLLTLTGAGGCGKTRLAMRVAHDVLAEYADGVWFAELGALSDAELIPKAIASAVGVWEEPGRPLLSTLLERLSEKRLLIVLDNCEHLVAACAHIAEAILRACPAVTILATSRESLNITAERIWHVPSMELPAPRARLSVKGAIGIESVRLFVERAEAVRPSFRLTPENLAMVTEICRRLDGIPLAIELAAARTGTLAVSDIASRLDNCFRILTRGSRAALPRQQTLQATIDWSFRLLTEAEGILLRRLSVFVGGWTIDAPETLCVGDGIERADILDLLAQLIGKSLVLMDALDTDVRYRLLETVRQYGAAQLMASGETTRLRTQHLDWCVGLAERADPELVGVGQAAWLDRLELEHDNLRAALAWSLENARIEAGLRLAGAIWRFWWIRGYAREGRNWLETFLGRPSSASAVVRARGLQAAGILAVLGQGDYPSGRAFLTESLAIWREAGDRHNIAALLDNIGTLFSVEGDHPSARRFYEESLAIRRQLGDKWGVALSLNNLGFVLYRQNEYPAAYALFEESLTLWREGGDRQNIAKTLSNLGLVLLSQGSYEDAYAFLNESLQVRLEVGDKWGIAHSLEGLAGLAAAQGAAARAARLFGSAEALRESIGSPLRPTDRPDYEQKVAAARTGLTADAFAAAWSAGRAMTIDEAVREAADADMHTKGKRRHGPPEGSHHPLE